MVVMISQPQQQQFWQNRAHIDCAQSVFATLQWRAWWTR
jgi:hypothetical protein